MIDLSRPLRSEKRKGFQPPWYTVWVYECPMCKRLTYIRAGAFRGKYPEPGLGAIQCECEVLGDLFKD